MGDKERGASSGQLPLPARVSLSRLRSEGRTSTAVAALIGAIAGEVTGTISLRRASTGKKLWWASVIVGYVFALVMLSVVLGRDVALGVAYGIWVAAGVAITAVLGRRFFKEPLTWIMGLGLVFIIGGVLLIEWGGAHRGIRCPTRRPSRQ